MGNIIFILIRLSLYSYIIIDSTLGELIINEYSVEAFATSFGGSLYIFNFIIFNI